MAIVWLKPRHPAVLAVGVRLTRDSREPRTCPTRRNPGTGRRRRCPPARHKAPRTYAVEDDAIGWLNIERRKIDLGTWGAVERSDAITLRSYSKQWVEQRRVKGEPCGDDGCRAPIDKPKTALLTDPWVFGSARQGGAVAAEGEHGQGDQRIGGAESERNPGQQSDLGVGGFDQPLGQAVVEGGVDGLAVAYDATGQLHEHRDAAAPRPGYPPVQGFLAFFAFDRKHVP